MKAYFKFYPDLTSDYKTTTKKNDQESIIINVSIQYVPHAMHDTIL